MSELAGFTPATRDMELGVTRFRAEKYRSLRKEFFFSQVALATKNSFRSAASSIKSPAKRVLIEIK